MGKLLNFPPALLPRPSWDWTWYSMARIMADRATCPRKHVGAILVDPENQVLATGYNGAPRGMKHCSDPEQGCDLDETGHCTWAIHAEMNALLTCTKSTKCGIMYITHYPCEDCSMALVQAGISRMVTYDQPVGMRYQVARRRLELGGVEITLLKGEDYG